MLKRFLRGRGDDDSAGDPRTYLERLLDAAAPRATAFPSSGDPLVSLGEHIVAVEVDAGLPVGPTDAASRELFCRTYAGLLLDNDRVAPALQLRGSEIERPRALLIAFFTGAAGMHNDAQAVLRFVEERFALGRFSQARLLLQLFDTEAATRRNNERNLFYEEMALRINGERTSPISDATLHDVRQSLEQRPPAVMGDALARVGVRLHVFGTDMTRADAWQSALGGGAAEGMARRLPRWRPFGTQPTLDTLREHIAERDVQHTLLHVLRSAYFIALAPGITGAEHVLLDYLPWLAERYGVVSTRMLPQLHRDTTLDDLTIAEACERVWNEHFSDHVELATPSLDELEDALVGVHAELKSADLRRLPEGDYDLGGVVVARALGAPLGDAIAALRLHRLA